MTTSQQTSFLSEIINGERIPDEKLDYFRARLKNRLHAIVLTQFMRVVDSSGFTKADLARRLGKKPEQITRWLGAPGNWTLDTWSDLLLGMGYEPTLGASNLAKGAIQPANEQWMLATLREESAERNTEPLLPIDKNSKVIDLAQKLASRRDSNKQPEQSEIKSERVRAVL